MSDGANKQVGERLRSFRDSLGLTQAEMAHAVGGTVRGVQGNELGISLPNSKLLIALRGLGLNVDWLLTGEGSMLRTDPQATTAAHTSDLNAYGECLEILEIALNKANRVLAPEKKRAAVDSMYRAWSREKTIDRQLVEMILQLAA